MGFLLLAFEFIFFSKTAFLLTEEIGFTIKLYELKSIEEVFGA